MDWSSIAELLAERESQPVAILDSALVIRGVNERWERLSGRPREDVVGRRWTEVMSPAESASVVETQLEAAFSGEIERFDSWCVGPGGRVVLATFESSRAGRRERALILVAVAQRELSPSSAATDPCFRIEFEAGPARFGEVRSFQNAAGERDLGAGVRCYEVLHGRSLPCGDCPARLGTTQRWPRASVQPTVDGPRGFRVLTEQLVAPDLVEARVTVVPEWAVGTLLRARITRLAEEAGLTEREREVLDYLVLGRTAHDIAKLLGVASRTVKFHQANVLAKLGADSRVDLVRLLL